jgi:hypothetical protein
VDLLLVLAVDASGSVSEDRWELQRSGYVAAFRDGRVRAAIRGGALGGIAATMVQWTGPGMAGEMVPWSVLADEASLDRFATAIDLSPRVLFGGGTSLSWAIDHGMAVLRACPFEGTRRVIDISGDGVNNRGRPAAAARDAAVAEGVVVNGLAIPWIEPDLEEHYRSQVIGGPGAFVVVAESYAAFGQAIVSKLVQEIAARDRRAG